MSKKCVSDYVPVSDDSEDEKDLKKSSISNSRSVGSQSGVSSVSINCKTQTFPVDDLFDRNATMMSNSSTMHIEQKTVNNWDKFRLLMWKNFLIQWRHKWRLLFEISIPILLIILLVYIRSQSARTIIDEPTKFDSFDIKPTLVNEKFDPIGKFQLIFCPNNAQLNLIVKDASHLLGMAEPIGVSSSAELEQIFVNQSLIAGIEFDVAENTTELPKKLQYALRFPNKLRRSYGANWQTNMIFPIGSMNTPREKYSSTGGSPSYRDEGFLWIQNTIAEAILRNSNKAVKMPFIQMQRFPYPPYIEDSFLTAYGIFVAYLIFLSFIYPCVNIVRYIAVEKEKQLKEAMKIMGLPNWLHWLGWFIKAFIYMLVIITIITILLKSKLFDAEVAVFEHTNIIVLWIFLFVYSIGIICASFSISVLFSKANTATVMAVIIWIALYEPYSLTVDSYDNLSTFTKVISCLCLNSGLGFGIHLMLRLEGKGEGLNWSNLAQPVTIDDELTVLITMVMMVIASLIHLILTLYIEQVRPGEYGVPQPWYFPLRKEFWFGIKSNSVGESTILMEEISTSSNGNMPENLNNFETDPANKYAGIKVVNIQKVYGKNKIAVDNLTINMYEDQITVLLGHNGAGKTTAMSMITGMFPPTSGTAYVNGFDIRTNTHKARESIGLCPQYNVLFDELTVREHIQFFSQLKGSSSNVVEEEVKKYVHAVELEPKIDAMAGTLSGGMKRKLSAIIALCGRSKVVLCDEPTSGMDPSARRALWDLLQTEKKGRTILLSTHFMDEADILGDRIAIMAEGELKCCGSSFFLKKQLGTGYHLICVKGDNCKIDDVTSLLRKYISNIKIANNIGEELSYQLPDEKISMFEQMFKDIEDNKNELNLESFGVSLTTLEDVFMKVGTDSEVIHKRDKVENYGTTNEEDVEKDIGDGAVNLFDQDVKLMHGYKLWMNQCWAMLRKRFIYLKRSWFMFLLQNVIAVSLVGAAIFTATAINKYLTAPALKFDLSSYGKSVTILEKNGTQNEPFTKIFREYDEMFKSRSKNDKIDKISNDFQNYFLNLGKDNIVYMNFHYIVAATIGNVENNTLTAWFSGQPLHAAPLSLNLLHNAIFRAFLGSDYSLSVTNKPITVSDNSSSTDLLNNGTVFSGILTFALSLVMGFVVSFYIMFYIKERASNAKHLQFVSGVNVFIFWIISLLWDYLTYIITLILIVGSIAIFQIEEFSSIAELSRLGVILFCLGFAVLPINCLISFIFSTPSNGYTVMSIFNFFSGLPMYLVSQIVVKSDVGKCILQLLFPFCSFIKAMLNLLEFVTKESFCKRTCKISGCECKMTFFGTTDIGHNLLLLAGSGLLYLLIIFLIEFRILSGIMYIVLDQFKRKLPSEIEGQTIDSDVLEEKQEVNSMTPLELASQNLVIRKISKFYGKFLAVNQLSLAVKPSECFGLLGVNGAGKTTTFKMLTGHERISYGDGWARGISLRTSMTSVHKIIGYCPQFDALLDELTGNETIEIFALLRGISRNEINELTKKLANELNFATHLAKKVSEFSGGNKRKLSTAVSLLGNPYLVYLDEPTTGMDVGAKRSLWNMVNRARNSGKSIILTSHSMEECEALCTRLAIMVNGQFKCLGSTQHLKNKFSKGYILTVKNTKTNDAGVDISSSRQFAEKINQIKDYIMKNFTESVLREEHQGLLTYYIPPNNDMSWSKMFGIMEKCKNIHDIEDYSISQTTLEQVFLSFTKYQIDKVSTQYQDDSVGQFLFPWSQN